MRTGSDELLKKLALEKNQYKKRNSIYYNPWKPCPRCSGCLEAGNSCSPLMYIDTHAIIGTTFKKEAAKNNSTFVKSLMTPCYQGWKIY
jgi:hypothetical protein